MTQTRSQPAVKTPVPEPRHVWRHAVEWTLAAGLVTFIAAFLHMPVLAAVILTLVAGGAVAGSVAAATHSPQIGLFALVAALAAGGWMVAARLDGVWHWPVLVALVAAGGGLMVAGATIYDRHIDERRTAAAGEASRAAMAECRKMTDYFTKVGLAGVVATHIEPTRAGREVKLRLPSNGSVTLTTLRLTADRLAVAMKTEAESIAFSAGAHGGEAVMTLDESDVMEEDVPFPESSEILTITKALAIGLAAAGQKGKILFREVATLLTGLRGTGKSNLLNVLIAQFTSCVDVIVFAIDLSGGSLASPWLQPWVEDELLNGGRGSMRPAIDWVATTREEAWAMLCATDRLVTWRRQENGAKRRSKVTPSNKKPAVMVIGDEIADIFGQNVPRSKQAVITNDQMVGMGTDITRQSRAAAIEPIWATQRPTVTMAGSGDLKSQCTLRLSLGQVAEHDAASAVPDSSYAAKLIARLRHPGTGVVWQGGDNAKSVAVWKFYRLDPDPEKYPEDCAKLHRIATRNSRIRPAFDEGDLAALGEPYRNRWENSRLFQSIAAEMPVPEQPAATQAASAGPAQQTATAVVDREADLAAFEQMVSDDPELSGLSGLASGFTGTGTAQPWQLRMYSMLAERPRTGMQVAEIRPKLEKAGFKLTREHISKSLAKDEAKGIVFHRGEQAATRWFLSPGVMSQ